MDLSTTSALRSAGKVALAPRVWRYPTVENPRAASCLATRDCPQPGRPRCRRAKRTFSTWLAGLDESTPSASP